MDKGQCLRLIELYASYRRLWDSRNPDYTNKSSRDEAWMNISRELALSVGEIKNKMGSLLGSYRREKSREKKSRNKDSGRQGAYKSNWYAYQCFQFMADKNKSGNTQDAVHNDELKIDCKIKEVKREKHNIQDSHSDRIEEKQTHRLRKRTKKRVGEPQQDLTDQVFSKAIRLLKQSADSSRDSYCTFGQHIANELRKYDAITLAHVKNAINNIIFEADTGIFQRSYTGNYTEPARTPRPSSATNSDSSYTPAQSPSPVTIASPTLSPLPILTCTPVRPTDQ